MNKSRNIATQNTGAAAAAIEFLGGPSKVSSRLREAGIAVSAQAVQKWRKRLPPTRVILIETLTERRFTRYELRPDLYPREVPPTERLAA